MESQQSMGTTVPSCHSDVGVSEEGQREKAGACHGALLEGQKLYSWAPFVASEYTGLLPSRTSRGDASLHKMKDTLVLYPHPFLPAQLGDSLLDGTGFFHQGIRHCVFDKKALMAGW